MNNADGTFDAVRACSIVLLSGAVLHAAGVSAGNGIVIDWRNVRCGETIVENADAFDVAQAFVALVGVDTALSFVSSLDLDAVPRALVTPRIYAYMRQANGGRLRSFEARGFKVIVEAHEDDAAQEEFARRLAELTTTLE